jgi:hypothetical protein
MPIQYLWEQILSNRIESNRIEKIWPGSVFRYFQPIHPIFASQNTHHPRLLIQNILRGQIPIQYLWEQIQRDRVEKIWREKTASSFYLQIRSKHSEFLLQAVVQKPNFQTKKNFSNAMISSLVFPIRLVLSKNFSMAKPVVMVMKKLPEWKGFEQALQGLNTQIKVMVENTQKISSSHFKQESLEATLKKYKEFVQESVVEALERKIQTNIARRGL